jgi:hypothetical protein
MTYKDWDSPNWRDDTGLSSHLRYERKWALLPVICSGEKVWLKHYYSVTRKWCNKHVVDPDIGNNSHEDFIGNITEADYIIRKLAENL